MVLRVFFFFVPVPVLLSHFFFHLLLFLLSDVVLDVCELYLEALICQKKKIV